ncbi:MAG TPA: ATP-binding protein [Actinomycetota bacterium]|nr:ATP-binding protein [Actinomycetota bacterium]
MTTDGTAAVGRGHTGSTRDVSSILIVDDRPENLLALEAALAPIEQNIIRAGSGEEALRALLKHEVAVIILDVQMPGLDGFETAAYIKQLDRTKHIPIIFLTAINKEAQHVFRGYTAGAVDYLFKPFDPTMLRSKVAVFIDLHQKKRELQTSEERFRRAFDHAPIGVALVGLQGSLLKVNRALKELTGFSRADLVTKTIHELIHSDDIPIDLGALANDVAGAGASWHAEHRIVTRDGSERHALVSVSFIPSAAGMGPHFIFQITDITERRELESFRERFVSHAAHELRTPATVIAGTASLLYENPDLRPAEVQQCITALYRQSQRLTAMVRNLLDLSRLKEGRLKAKLEQVDVGRLASLVLEHTPPPEQKSVMLSVEEGCFAMVDAEGMDHILTNLLVNAYRYGGDEIWLEAERDATEVVVAVSDNGPGVPTELIPKLFDPFTRGKLSSAVGGSGLGLALVESLVQASGGEIRYDPRPEGGSTFAVRLAAP